MAAKPHPDWQGKGYDHKHVLCSWEASELSELISALDEAQSTADADNEEPATVIMVDANVKGPFVERVELLKNTLTDGSVTYDIVLS